jgi:hypothetical protein
MHERATEEDVPARLLVVVEELITEYEACSDLPHGDRVAALRDLRARLIAERDGVAAQTAVTS